LKGGGWRIGGSQQEERQQQEVTVDTVPLGVSHFVTFCLYATPDSEQEIFLIYAKNCSI
jgi:hypothetical protein